MKNTLLYLLILFGLGSVNRVASQNLDNARNKGWISLFNGKSLDGWKVGENEFSFSVEESIIKLQGPPAHLFYVGDVENHNFQNFEFKGKVKTKPEANSGIYIHTKYQEDGWPSHGYEVQVNNSHEDWKRTGSLYGIVDIKENYVQDNEWFTEYIKVKDKRIIIKINGTVVVDYTEPDHPKREKDRSNRVLNGGTFALQAHDPGSIIF